MSPSPIADCLERGEPPLPWIYAMAARLEGEDREAMVTDPGVLTRSLTTAADLFNLPAVSTSFDTTIEAEAAGCGVDRDGGGPQVVEGCIGSVDEAFDLDVAAVTDGGRVPTVLDATDRLVTTLDGTSVLGGLTGPRRLADSLLVDADDASGELRYEATLTASDIAIELANAYLDRGADGIAVLEPDGVEDTDQYIDAMTPLANVIDHYDGTGVVVQRAVEVDHIALAGKLGFDAITGYAEAPSEIVDAADRADVTVGLGVPLELFQEGPEAVAGFVADLPSNVLPSTEWEVPEGTDPETIHRLVGSR